MARAWPPSAGSADWANGSFMNGRNGCARPQRSRFSPSNWSLLHQQAVTALVTPAQSAPLEARLRGDRSVRVGPDFEAGHFRRLLQILAQEP
ncbi:MAG: hypothetical protein JO182_25640 [Acidobacteriaceae bacterium]|nr:hypothetical protein [Acidobacteriaceae bacterium]